MTYAEYIRDRRPLDDHILLLLSLDLPLRDGKSKLGVYQVAKLLGISHQSVYNCLERNQLTAKEFLNGTD
jgi:hypothetical protein